MDALPGQHSHADVDTAAVVAKLRAALGPDVVRTGADMAERGFADAAGYPPTAPAAQVLPTSTDDIATVLTICNDAGQPVVVQGGMTGFAAGAHPVAGEIAMSLERMRGVQELDPVAGTITVLAGTTLQEVQGAADDAGFVFGLDLGARGTATIGGNVSTNAGGNQVLRYGMVRRSVLGFEVVQADGTVLTSLKKMLKNNTGYDWQQLFIGSEGTLGIVTRVMLMLHPKPGPLETALLAVPDAKSAIAILQRLERSFGDGLLTFEGMWRELIDVAVQRQGNAEPFEGTHDLYLLVEVAQQADSDSERFTNALAQMLEDGLIADALIAQSGADRGRMWAFRESMYDYRQLFGTCLSFDISVERPSIDEAVAAFRSELSALTSGMFVVFGHIADSNLHVIVGPMDGTRSLSDEEKARAEAVVYGVTARYGGSVSAEHGIGRSKRKWLPLSRTEPELALMRTLKNALDPKGILNPGRII